MHVWEACIKERGNREGGGARVPDHLPSPAQSTPPRCLGTRVGMPQRIGGWTPLKTNNTRMSWRPKGLACAQGDGAQQQEQRSLHAVDSWLGSLHQHARKHAAAESCLLGPITSCRQLRFTLCMERRASHEAAAQPPGPVGCESFECPHHPACFSPDPPLDQAGFPTGRVYPWPAALGSSPCMHVQNHAAPWQRFGWRQGCCAGSTQAWACMTHLCQSQP